MLCRHCQMNKISRPRGLCWNCYYLPGVREQVPSTSKFGRRGPGKLFAAAALWLFPTVAPPASSEKVAILEQRAALHQELFHPDDATLEPAVRLAQVGWP